MSFNNLRMHCYLYCKTVCVFTIWLGQRADMIKQILGSYKLTWGGGGGEGLLPAMSRQKRNCIGQKIKKLLIDVACSIKTAKY